ncbi:MAG: 4-hydroxybenzoate octaprenyltransferase [Alphaproteobacteria bacterium]|nr:4-hydroxybenzoate octaprenyltransferase [Alphaproteobacteria bacterium]
MNFKIIDHASIKHMTHTDIKSEGWISRLPQSWQPYAILMRLDRPVGWWLLLLPGWWGIMLGANGIGGMVASDWRLMILFLVGAIIMRGAGCIINDLWDRDFDKQVERTKLRPLASGQVSTFQAGALLFFLLFCGFIILLQTSLVTILLGVLSLAFVAVYPFMKRITWWPQAFLGLTFNFSALMGWSAAMHRMDIEALALYGAGFFWTLGYDTIYAHQDREDDALAGIKSTARLFGENSHFWVGIFYLLTLVFLALALFLAGGGVVGYILLIFPALHLAGQVMRWNMYDSYNCLHIFKSNRNFGLWVLLVMACSHFSVNGIEDTFRDIISISSWG